MEENVRSKDRLVYNDSATKKPALMPLVFCCTVGHQTLAPDDYVMSPGATYRCPECQEAMAYVWSSHKRTHVWCVIDDGSSEFNGIGRAPNIEEDEE